MGVAVKLLSAQAAPLGEPRVALPLATAASPLDCYSLIN